MNLLLVLWSFGWKCVLSHLTNSSKNQQYTFIHYSVLLCKYLTFCFSPLFFLITADDGIDSSTSLVSADAEEEELDHHLLSVANSDVAFLNEKTVRVTKEVHWLLFFFSLHLIHFCFGPSFIRFWSYYYVCMLTMIGSVYCSEVASSQGFVIVSIFVISDCCIDFNYWVQIL